MAEEYGYEAPGYEALSWVEVPHFFADKEALRKLFHDYTFDRVRHITECVMEGGVTKERSHYFIEATVHK